MAKLRIYDPAMCCTTGVCGPSVDPELTRVASAIFLLEKNGVDIKRFNLTSEPEAFVENSLIQGLLNEKGMDGLPAVLVDDEIRLVGRYPSVEEFATWTDMSIEQLSKDKSTKKGIELL
ncbi:arsenite efflux transporter metallochaperone ArsD [Bacillus suaedae]|uniref:Arsenite efflux transporter metallochaperone ArsD n=1 Tax=Halalkalibacter suaedae TaxID=2822140 RepID=A0A940WWW2_9BACI|nr:arsenite efflux transporter metallochaperone ArsD [Bacillus suaedae]MBP3949626.1 arsenite efflux transporter metallochaperone ArsD [Bacillus suaedae]